MKHFYKLFFFIILIPAFSYAQSNYKPGYVVTLKGDTLHGFIDYKEWSWNPKQVDFKQDDAASQGTIYTTSTASAFAVNGFEHYDRAVLAISQDRVNTSSLSRGIDTSELTDAVFLRVLNTGKNVTLYVYTDNIKERFFISEGNGQPVELIYHKFLDADQASNIITRDTYKRQLQRLASVYQPGNGGLLAEIQNTPYLDAAIFKIADKINGAHTVQNVSSDRKSARFFVGLAINNSTINSSSGNGVSVTQSSSPFFPKIDAGFDLFTNKNVGKLIFRTELSFTGDKDQFNYSGSADNGFGFKETVKFSQYITSLNPQLLYNVYNEAAIKIYIALGAKVSYCLYTNKTDMYTDLFDSNPTPVSQPDDFPALETILFNITTKVGVSVNNKFEVYAGYDPPETISGHYQYTLKLTTYQLGFNYLFGEK